MLKVSIVVLFIAVLASLSGGLVYLLRASDSESKRTLYALGIRIGLATLLLALIAYGLYSGELSSTAPWDRGPTQ